MNVWNHQPEKKNIINKIVNIIYMYNIYSSCFHHM